MKASISPLYAYLPHLQIATNTSFTTRIQASKSFCLGGLLIFGTLLGCGQKVQQSMSEDISSDQALWIDPSSINNKLLTDYWEFQKGSYEITMVLQHNSVLGTSATPASPPAYSLETVGNFDAWTTIQEGTCDYSAKIGQYELACYPGGGFEVPMEYAIGGTLRNLYGQSVSFEVTGADGIAEVQHQLDVPDCFKGRYPLPHSEHLTAGTQIRWNPSPNNEEVILTMSYKAGPMTTHWYSDRDLASLGQQIIQTYPARKAYVKVLPDVGSYTLTESDLAQFSSGMVLNIQLARGSFQSFASLNGNKATAIGAVTTISWQMKVEP
ncbi:hypothetical protein [Pontibacter sp. G13]|uniref:hypothetical protein n=1 Tax=Pontibacter sp. G13 TaxID=3074898 RepID=UPI00288C3AE9|nr:hypothetical protein [Pontibacter sp. G13]WNJ18781.1 hypothetical protein RJD25_28325 [Pontibacter sp. G13]